MQPPQRPPSGGPPNNQGNWQGSPPQGQGGWNPQQQQPQGQPPQGQGGWNPQQQPPQGQPPQGQGGWNPQQQPPQQGGWNQPPQQQPGWGQQPPQQGWSGGGGYQDPYHDPYSQPPAPPERNWLLIGGIAVGGLFCFLGLIVLIVVLAASGGDDNEPTAVVNVGSPSVTISSPTGNQQFNVGSTITVQAQATDPGTGITRVELLANNVVVDSQTSQNPQGEKTLSVLLDYTAAVPMDNLTLTVRAYRGVVRGTDATLNVRVVDQDATEEDDDDTGNNGSNNSGGNQSGGNTSPPPFNPTCRARVDVTTMNLRRGPSTDYEILGTLGLGTEVPLVGRLGDNSWWEVNRNNTRGWLSASLTTLLGNCGSVAITTPPVSPTPQPSATSAAPAQANLIISTFSGPNNIVLTGGQAAATYVLRVRNVGGSAVSSAFNVTTTFPNGTVSDFTIASLGAGQETTVEGIQATFTAPGTYRISVLVDSSGNITESNKADNTAYLDITVVAPTPTPE